jgi:hypothetical protein
MTGDGRRPAGPRPRKFAQEVTRDFAANSIEDNLVNQTEAALRESESRLRRGSGEPAQNPPERRHRLTQPRNDKLTDWASFGGATERREIRLSPAR